MEQLAKKKSLNPDVVERFGKVIAMSSNRWIVRAEGEIEVTAHRAVGCLVRPEVGDTVLVAWGGVAQLAYILTVIEREGESPLEIGCTGDATLSANHLVVQANQGVVVSSATTVDLAAKTIALKSEQTSVVSGRLEWIAQALEVQAMKVRTIADSVESFVETTTERVKRAFRFVEELDVKRASKVDHAATETYSLRAHDAMIQVEQLIKIDGDQVHLG